MPDSPFFRYAKSEGRLSDCYCVMVIKTIGRLFSRKVLIVPQTVKTTDWLNRILKINISKKKIETSPDINTNKFVSLQKKIERYDHYA